MTAFPWGVPVAVVGSRHGSPYHPERFARAVIRSGGVVVTGCAAGVDLAARTAAAAEMQAAHANPAALHVEYAESGEPWALARRTGRVVAAAAAVAVFPLAGGAFGPGSALALRLALGRGVPVFVAGPLAPAGTGWQSVTLQAVAGWLHLPETALF